MTSTASIRDALLIATGEYKNSNLRQLRSPAKDASDLASVLQDPAIGGFRVNSVIDKPHYIIARSIEEFFQKRSPGDLLLVHLSCHGLKDADGFLHFAATNTDPDLPASTAVAAEFLRSQLLRSRARSIVLLLDCCYSGSFLAGMKGERTVDIKEELAGHGRAVITATNRTEYAWEGTNIIELEPGPSLFTEAIVNGLRTGDADLDGDGKIAVDELYDYVYERLHRAKAHQTPRKWVDLEYRVFVATAKQTGKVSANRVSAADVVTNVPKNRTRRGRSMTIRSEFPLIETALGTTKELELKTATRCVSCGATGNASREMPVMCQKCHGSGRINPLQNELMFCVECSGFGTVIQDPCPECNGEGRVQAEHRIKVRVPAGIEHGAHVLFAGEGEAGPLGGPNGDLFLEVVELTDSRFERRGDDLYSSVTISKSVAENGGGVDVETLEARRLVKIPPGTKTGTLLRVAGAGVPHTDGGRVIPQHGSARGNLMVRVEVEG